MAQNSFIKSFLAMIRRTQCMKITQVVSFFTDIWIFAPKINITILAWKFKWNIFGDFLE